MDGKVKKKLPFIIVILACVLCVAVFATALVLISSSAEKTLGEEPTAIESTGEVV